jgi:SAM-dependent methyltransferase
LDSKLQRLLGTDQPGGFGLEIGALAFPLLRKGQHDVLYVDYAPTAVIKANQFDPSVPVDEIVEVDVVWGERPLAECVGRPADYVAASHVIEHVPDLIGWLAELAEVLRTGGVLGLAIPDRRFTFDALRRDTVLADVVEAYLLGAKQPSLRQIFDAASLGVAVDASSVWGGDFDPAERRDEVLARLKPALALAKSLKAEPRYRDAHCWVFTPASFLDLLEELATLELLPFRIDALFPTEPGAMEFQVRLVRAPDPKDPAVARSIAAARAVLPAPAEPEQGPDEALGAAVASEAEKELAAARQELATIHASKSWRLTGAFRALRRTLRI